MLIKEIEVEPLASEVFAPSGWLLTAGDTPDFEHTGLKNWRLPFTKNP